MGSREGICMEMDKFTCSDNTCMNWLKKGVKMQKPLVDLLKLKLLKSTLSLCCAKNPLHYSSEEGVEMAMTYLTIIETAKMWGLQVKEYLTYVWCEVMNGHSVLPHVPKVSRIQIMSQRLLS